MKERGNYSFCPKCGALMEDGYCHSCGYRCPGNRGRAGTVILAAASAAAMAAVLIAVIFFSYRAGRETSKTGDAGPGFAEGQDKESGQGVSEDIREEMVLQVGERHPGSVLLTGNSCLLGGWPAAPVSSPLDYRPKPEDDFYYYLTDALEYHLSYAVLWGSETVADGNGKEYICTVPRVKMEDEKKEERINKRILDMLDGKDGEQLERAVFYVTYMSEEILSVVQQDPAYYLREGGSQPGALRAVNFDMASGREIPAEGMIEISPGMASRFWNLCAYEHPGDPVLETFQSEEALGLSDPIESIRETVRQLSDRLSNPETQILFYTPVGLEVGFNHADGWITATFNRNASLPFYRYFLEEPDYEPGAEDPYYRELVNAVRGDLSYQVEFHVCNFEDETGRYYLQIPQLAGGHIPNLDTVNERIRKVCWKHSGEAYIGGPDGIETRSYVTYMDEEVISIVVAVYWYYLTGEGIYEEFEWIDSVTFDLKNGEEIPKDEILEMDIQFAEKFQELVLEQKEKNPDSYYILSHDPEWILKNFLADNSVNVVFYTPVGVEAGYVQTDICTVTVKGGAVL